MDTPSWYPEYRDLRNRADMGQQLTPAEFARLDELEAELRKPAAPPPPTPPKPADPGEEFADLARREGGDGPPLTAAELERLHDLEDARRRASQPAAEPLGPDALARLAKHPQIKKQYGFTAETLAKMDPRFVRQLAEAAGVDTEPETVERLGKAAERLTAATGGSPVAGPEPAPLPPAGAGSGPPSPPLASGGGSASSPPPPAPAAGPPSPLPAADPLGTDAAGKLTEAADKLIRAAESLEKGTRQATDPEGRPVRASGLDRQRRGIRSLGGMSKAAGGRVSRLLGGYYGPRAGAAVTGTLDRLTGVAGLRDKVDRADKAATAEARARERFAAAEKAARAAGGAGGAGGIGGVGGAGGAGGSALASAAEAAGGQAVVAGGAAARAAGAAAATNPATLGLAAVTATALAFNEAQRAVRDFARQQQEANFQLAEFSSAMAQVAADFEARNMARRQEEGDRLAGSAQRLADANDEYMKGTQEIRVAVEKLTNVVTAELLQVVTRVIEPINEVARLLNDLLGEDEPATGPLRSLIEEADKEIDRRRQQHREDMERLDLRERQLRDERFR